jgi:hypothetical protein
MQPTHYIVRSVANTCGGHNIRSWVGSSLGFCPPIRQRVDIGETIRVNSQRWKVVGHAMIGERGDVPIALLREVVRDVKVSP